MDTSVLAPTSADSMSEKEEVASVLIPWPVEDNKAKYLRLRACGHSVRETLRHLGVGQSSLSAWRKNPQFLHWEEDLPNIRRQLAKEWMEFEFIRNFSLATMKDGELLEKSRKTRLVKNEETDRMVEVPIPLTRQEHEWLMKRQSNWTPQQLQAVMALNGASTGDTEESFQEAILKLRDMGNGTVVLRERTIELPSVHSADAVDSPHTIQVDNPAPLEVSALRSD